MRLPALRKPLFVATVIYMVAFLFWLGIEDTDTTPVALFGFGAAALAAWHFAQTAFSNRVWSAHGRWLAFTIGGAVTGAGASPITVLLMAIKVSLHSHQYPDFSLTAVAAIIALAPAWALGGALAGAGLALISLAMSRR